MIPTNRTEPLRTFIVADTQGKKQNKKEKKELPLGSGMANTARKKLKGRGAQLEEQLKKAKGY